jgi:thiamine-phosphate pyrophosphorylase
VRWKVAGLYAITPDEPDTARLQEKARRAIAGGARLVQYRNKSASAALKAEQVRALLRCCREAGVPLVINDDLALALESGADGLHLGRDDGDLALARRALGDGALLGASCYDRLDLAERAVALGADHIAFGSVFGSTTKPGAVSASLDLFRQARKRLPVPLVAIGGIKPENAGEAIAAGADAVAVISALFNAEDVQAAARQFSLLFEKRFCKP